MCGIVGWVNHSDDISANVEILEDMMNSLSHRGPDSYGTYINKNTLLGHRRLIVIDPAGGQQPMTKIIGDEKYTIVYNGELYNTEDLRTELEGLGYSFKSYSDTEVLLTSYINWKEDCVKHLNGIFAFCILDEKNNRIFLARDHLGVKPVFYIHKGDSFFFASEIKALFAHPDIKPVIDEQGLLEIFGLSPATDLGSGVFKGIHEIPPAHALTFSDGKVNIWQYWELEAAENRESLSEIIEHTRELLINAIERQLASDVPICTFLSGGLDSSIISTVASNNAKKLRTFSVDYVDNDKYFKTSLYQPNTDSHYIGKMVDFLDSDHTNVVLSQKDLADALEDAVIARDLPGMADVDSSLLLFCKEIKKQATVAISGECSDEIFGGYPWFTRSEDLNGHIFPWARSIEHRKKLLNADLKKLPLEEYVNSKYAETIAKVPKLDGEGDVDRKIREMTYLNIKWFMLTLLNRKDRMSMHTSLEVRVPFADYRLVEYAYNIPGKYKLLHGREKGLLREALKNLMPKEIVDRKKSPYPKTHNPVYTKIVSQKLKSLIDDSNAPIRELINFEYLRSLINTEGASFKSPWYGQLMKGPQVMALIIQINTWLEHYGVEIKY